MSIHITWEQIERTFGVANRILDSYIERKGIDDRFKEALRGRNIIVVHGSSKQGKTSLWKKHVDPKDRYPPQLWDNHKYRRPSYANSQDGRLHHYSSDFIQLNPATH